MNVNKPLTAQEAANYLNIKLSYLYNLVQTNKIKHSKPNNGKLYFRQEWLDDYAFGDATPTLDEEAEAIMQKRGL